MQDIFTALTSTFCKFGDVLEANMYQGGGLSTLKIKYKGNIYKISILKETSNGNDND